jgi:hypothetical protein
MRHLIMFFAQLLPSISAVNHVHVLHFMAQRRICKAWGSWACFQPSTNNNMALVGVTLPPIGFGGFTITVSFEAAASLPWTTWGDAAVCMLPVCVALAVITAIVFQILFLCRDCHKCCLNCRRRKPDNDKDILFVGKDSEKYHLRSNCSGMKSRALQPCLHCFPNGPMFVHARAD